MNKLHFTLILLIVGGLLNISFFVASDFQTRYKEKSKSTSSIVCDYVQEKRIAQVKEPVVSKGKFFYSRPGKIRLEQQVPNENLIILSGDSLYTKEGSKIQRMGMEDHPYFKYLNDLILGTVNGEVLEGTHFDFSLSDMQDQTLLRLVPKSRMMKRKFSEINLKFDSKTLNLNAIEMVEKSGDAVTMTFVNPVFNSSLRKELFKL